MSNPCRILFRTDASLVIGTGHVMRCLTLAESLRQEGAEVTFVSRTYPGNLIGMLQERDFSVHELQLENSFDHNLSRKNSRLTVEKYVDWLGCTQEEDLQATLKVLGKEHYDWLIVDHYALDERWENKMRQLVMYVMVIDDLANRQHDCDILLDQNYYNNMNIRYVNRYRSTANYCLGLSLP